MIKCESPSKLKFKKIRIQPESVLIKCNDFGQNAWMQDDDESGNDEGEKDILKSVELRNRCDNNYDKLSVAEEGGSDRQSSVFETIRNKRTKKFNLIRNQWKSSWNIPWVVILISFIQITIFNLADEKLFENLLYSPHKKQEFWRFFTYSILHSDSIHLILNISLQFLIGFVLETEQGHFKVVVIYLGGVFGGSLGTSLFQPTLLMVGSSAGVYSLLISHVPHLILNFSSLTHRYFRIISVIVLLLSDVSFVTFHCLQNGDIKPKISFSAHICGAISGLLLGFGIYSESKIILFQIFKYVSFVLYTIFIILTIVHNFIKKLDDL